jgi:hypothetical protein
MFVWEHDNLIESKLKQIMITNSKSTKILVVNNIFIRVVNF